MHWFHHFLADLMSEQVELILLPDLLQMLGPVEQLHLKRSVQFPPVKFNFSLCEIHLIVQRLSKMRSRILFTHGQAVSWHAYTQFHIPLTVRKMLSGTIYARSMSASDKFMMVYNIPSDKRPNA